MKKTLLFIFAALISCMTVFAQNSEAKEIASGNCGETLKWTIGADSVLTISGSGVMTDYKGFVPKKPNYETSAPWMKHYELIKNVVVEEGCTKIGNYAFNYLTIPEIKMPASVKEWGMGAFQYVEGIKSYEVPANIKMGLIMFQHSSLETVTFAEGIDEIPTGMFMLCESLNSVTLPASLKTLGLNAFNGCSKLDYLEIKSAAVPACGKNVFSKVSTQIEFVFPAELKDNYVADANFKPFVAVADGNCGVKDAEASLRWKLTSDSVLVVRGEGAMADYKGFTPKTPNYEKASPWMQYRDAIKSIAVKEGCTKLGNYAFNYLTLPEIEMPASVKEWGLGAFQFVEGMKSYEVPAGIKMGVIMFQHAKLEEVSFEDGVKEIQTGMFMLCDSLKKVTLPESLNTIGMNAFNQCKQIKSLVVPANVDSIGKMAFKESKFETFEIKALVPPTVVGDPFEAASKDFKFIVPMKSLDKYKADEYWKQFTNINGVLPGGQCGDSLTWELGMDSVLTISGTGKMWDLMSFSDQPWVDYKTEIKSIVIEEGVTSVGQFAFHTCNMVESVKFASTVTSIGDMSFMQFPTQPNHLTEIEFPAGLTYLGEASFMGTKISTVVVPESLKTLGTGTFMMCADLKTVELPEGLETIGMNVFNQCKAMKSVVIPSTVDSIGMMAFGMTQLETVEIKATVPPVVGGDVFKMANTEFDLLVPASAVEAYKADEYWKQFKNIVAALPNGKCGDNLTWKLGMDSVLTISGTGKMWDLMSFAEQPWVDHKAAIKAIVIEEGVTSVGQFAFHTCNMVESVKFASTVTSIGDMSFMQFPTQPNHLTEIEFPAGLTYLGDASFMGTKISTVVVPESLKTLQTGTFMMCADLKTVVLPEGLETIGMNVFNQCKSIKSVVVPSTVDSIGKMAFAMTQLDTVEIKATVPPTVGGDVFMAAKTDFKFVIPASAVEAYKADEYWKQFVKEEETDVEETETSNVVVYSNGNGLVIEGAEGDFVIYNVTGSVVYVGNDTVVELPRGIYIVKGEDFCEKVVF